MVVRAEPGLTERRMFGGLAFLIHGTMAVSASSQGGLLLRVDPAEADSLISAPHVRRFEMRGRTMNGWLRVDTEVVQDDDDLRGWVRHGVTYARTLAGGRWSSVQSDLRDSMFGDSAPVGIAADDQD
ncbi:TfoX/Sxy family protein [Micromonospora coriariae]|nr:TfoX/Sxy family protein [Micromonospora coriariae]